MTEIMLESGIVVPNGFVRDTKSDRISQQTVRPGLDGGAVISKFKDYNSFLEAFKIDWVNACVSVIAYNFAATPWELVEGEDPIANEEEDPLVQLMQRPNPAQSGHEFLEKLAMYLELTGNAYITLEERDSDGRPTQLYLPNPARMRIVPDPDEFIKGYAYDVGTSLSGGSVTLGGVAKGGLIPYEPDEVIHIKMSNPLDDYYGMGNVEGMQMTLEIIQAMGQHELSYWQSGGRIIGTLQTDTKLSDPDFDRLRKHWRLANSDQKNRVRVAILEQGLKYQPIAEGLRSLDLVNIEKVKRDRALSVFGVPLPKLGIMEQAQFKLHEADQFFWQETMSPKFQRYEDGIQPLVDLFDEGKRWQFKRRNYEDDTEKLSNASTMSGLQCFTVNEIRAYLGMPELGPDGDIIWTQSLYVPVPIDMLEKYADEKMAPPAPPPGLGGGIGAPAPNSGGAHDTPAPRPGTSQTPGGTGPGVKPPGGPTPPAPVVGKSVDAALLRIAEKIGVSFVSDDEIIRRRNFLRTKAISARHKAIAMPQTPMDRVRGYATKRLGKNGEGVVVKSGVARHPAISEAIIRDRNQHMAEQVPAVTTKLKEGFRAQQRLLTKASLITRIAKIPKEPPETLNDRVSEVLHAVWPAKPIKEAITTSLVSSVQAGMAQGERILPPRKRARLVDSKEVSPQPNNIPSRYPGLGAQIDRSWQSIDDTTFQGILDQVTTGIDRGYSALQIANGFPDEEYGGIASVFADATDWRAEMIARTESANAYGWGMVQSSQDAGVTQMEALDGEEFDPECRDRDGTIFDLDPDQPGIVPDPETGDPVRDHPNGQLTWAPVAESIAEPDLSDAASTHAPDTKSLPTKSTRARITNKRAAKEKPGG